MKFSSWYCGRRMHGHGRVHGHGYSCLYAPTDTLEHINLLIYGQVVGHADWSHLEWKNQMSSPIWFLTSLSCSLSLSVSLSLSCALWRIYSGWNIPIFSNWWTSSRPKKSTSSSLSCEFRRLMSWGRRLSAFLLCSSGLLNCMCWIYSCGEWAVIAWGLVDMSAALKCTHLVFGYDCSLATPFSSACVLGEYDAFPWIC